MQYIFHTKYILSFFINMKSLLMIQKIYKTLNNLEYL